MCHDWFRIDYFKLNLHLIIEILAHICWRSEFIIARSLCWEITRNNSIISNFVLPSIRIVYIFESAMLARHHSDEPQLRLQYAGNFRNTLVSEISSKSGYRCNINIKVSNTDIINIKLKILSFLSICDFSWRVRSWRWSVKGT